MAPSDVDLAKAVGYTFPDEPVSWGKRDLILYALGIGATKDDFQVIYELDPSFTPFPTYPVVLPYKGTDTDLNDFGARSRARSAPGLPRFDPNRGVHASQTLELLKPLPPVGGDGWKLSRRITGVSENKSGIVVEAELTVKSPSGEPYARMYSAGFNLGAKAHGPGFSKRCAGPPPTPAIPKNREPDWTVEDQTTLQQAVLYRLSGDYNPLHVDPSIGKRSGFPGAILHGLSTYGFGARALIKAVGGGDAASLRYIAVRFTSPVMPGDKLVTRVWEIGPAPVDGYTELAFETRVVQSGKVVLGAGHAYVRKPSLGDKNGSIAKL